MLDLTKRRHGRASPRTGGTAQRFDEPLKIGQRVRDEHFHRQGAVIDIARQYAHPKAEPVYHYLLRWDDGQVQAVGEAAFDGDHGLDPVD